MSDSSRQVGDVTRAEALSLLAGVSLGRIVYTENAMPAVRSASHLVEEGDIIARSHDGSAVLPERETVVAYQADEIDTGSRLGWSVVVTGPARPVTAPDEIERYTAALPPWTAAESGQIIRVHPGIVTGYRLAEESALT
jgi:hypothetical protein